MIIGQVNYVMILLNFFREKNVFENDLLRFRNMGHMLALPAPASHKNRFVHHTGSVSVLSRLAPAWPGPTPPDPSHCTTTVFLSRSLLSFPSTQTFPSNSFPNKDFPRTKRNKAYPRDDGSLSWEAVWRAFSPRG